MAEEEEVKPSSWLRPFLKPMMPTFREVITMSAFVNLMALAVPVFTMQVYDRVVFHAGISTLWGLVIGMVIVIIFDLLLKVARSRVMQTVALRVDVLIGRQLFDKLVALPLAELESKPASHWQSLFRDVDAVRNTVSGASAVLVADLPFVLMFFVLIFVIATPVAWVLLVIVPIFMWVAWRSGNVMSQANKEERETTQSRDDLIAEMIQGRTTIKALALDRAMRPVWEQRHADNISRAAHRGAKTDFYSNLSGALTTATTVLMTTVGALAIINQDLTLGALIAANMLSGRLLGPLNQLVQQWRTYNSFRQSVDRLGETFLVEGERLVSEVVHHAPRGEIRVENCVFSYAPDLKPVISNVTVTLPAGGVHALVGRNGSGKTTLLKVIQGLYKPSTGRVLLDGADIAQFTRAELADWMGYVPQECVLFAGTIRDNIAHRRPEASDEQVVRAAKAAGAHQFIIDLPDGYASDIGEAGRRLSGGQRQRIAIARALVGDPACLMLDEPTASLDRQAEQALRDVLKSISQRTSVVIVTHSPIMLAACDDLVALDQGRIALAGPAKEILPRLFGQQPMPDAGAHPKPNGGAQAGEPSKTAPQPRQAAPPPAKTSEHRQGQPSTTPPAQKAPDQKTQVPKAAPPKAASGTPSPADPTGRKEPPAPMRAAGAAPAGAPALQDILSRAAKSAAKGSGQGSVPATGSGAAQAPIPAPETRAPEIPASRTEAPVKLTPPVAAPGTGEIRVKEKPLQNRAKAPSSPASVPPQTSAKTADPYEDVLKALAAETRRRKTED